MSRFNAPSRTQTWTYFKNSLNPFCFCGNEYETSTHYLLYCLPIQTKECPYGAKYKEINCGILELRAAVVTKILPFRDDTLSPSSNTFILNSTINYVISTKRFGNFILTHG